MITLENELMEYVRSGIARERWFVSKSRTIKDISIERDLSFSIGDSTYHILIVKTGFDDFSDFYALFLKKRKDVSGFENALGDKKFVNKLADVFLSERTGSPGIPGIFAELVIPPSIASGHDMDVVVNREEQSNSTVFLGKKLAMKFYRRLTPANSPDYELPKKLSSGTAFTDTPQCFGSLLYEFNGKLYLLCSIFQYIENEGSCWTWFTENLAKLLLSSELKDNSMNEEIKAIAIVTAELHNALSKVTDSSEYVDERDIENWGSEFRANLRALYSNRISNNLPPLPIMREISTANLEKVKRSPFRKIRIHGDYHLGQIIKAGKKYFVIDFEGEPMRSLEYRRKPSSVLKDVSGMLRSLHYAISYACMVSGIDPNSSCPEKWYIMAQNLFLGTYLTHMKGDFHIIPDDKEVFQALLDFFILDKAVYEALYEVNNRPEWTGIPLHAIKEILKNSSQKG